MEITFATRLDWDGDDDDSSGGFSIIEEFLMNNEDNILMGDEKELNLKFSITGNDVEWSIERWDRNVFCCALPMGDLHTDVSFNSLAAFVGHLREDENRALCDFLDYVIENLEEEVRWDSNCKTLLDEVKQYRDAEKAKELDHV